MKSTFITSEAKGEKKKKIDLGEAGKLFKKYGNLTVNDTQTFATISNWNH